MHIPWRAPAPRLDSATSPILADLANAAAAAITEAWTGYDREKLQEEVAIGADGTPSFFIDQLVEDRIIGALKPHSVNLLSEEIGFLDGGYAETVIIDPVDGSANAVAGVPLTCFSAALVRDDEVVEALNVWLENGHAVWAKKGEPVGYRTSGRRKAEGAAVDMLRPKRHAGGDSTVAWVRVADATSRIRVLSSSCLEAMLVAEGSIDAFLDPGSETHRIMDLAAALLFVPAAGGAVLDVHGREFTFDPDLTKRWSGVVASTRELAEELTDIVREDQLPK